MSLENETDCQVKVASKCNSKLFLSDDFRLVIFGSALYSLRTTSTLKPFPNEFYDHNQKEIQRDFLIKVYDNITAPIEKLYNQFNNGCQTMQLVRWILSQGLDHFTLKLISIDMIDPKARNIIEDQMRPHYIFENCNANNYHKMRTFANLRSKFGSFYAFHGSSMENFHSIIHNGLLYNLNKRSLLGVGTYVSTKIKVAFLYSPFGQNYFKGSHLGKKLSCIALCEVIRHPDIQLNDQVSYYVVANDEFIRVAYLLLYCSSVHSCIFPLNRLNPLIKITSIILFLFLIVLAFFILNYFDSERDNFYQSEF